MPRKKKDEITITKSLIERDGELISTQTDDYNDNENVVSADEAVKDKKGKAMVAPSGRFIAERRFVEIELLREGLGLSSASSEIYENWVASQEVGRDENGNKIMKSGLKIEENRDSNLRVEFKEKLNEELEDLPSMEESAKLEKGLTIFPKARFTYDPVQERFRSLIPGKPCPVGQEEYISYPYVKDHQIKGMFKEGFAYLKRVEGYRDLTATEKKILNQNRKYADLHLFIAPMKLGISFPEFFYAEDGVTKMSTFDENGRLRISQRPLRIKDASGERVAIAISEICPAGASFKFEIQLTSKGMWGLVTDVLDYGLKHGFSGWRNAGRGAYRWRELGEDWLPKTDWNYTKDEDDPYED